MLLFNAKKQGFFIINLKENYFFLKHFFSLKKISIYIESTNNVYISLKTESKGWKNTKQSLLFLTKLLLTAFFLRGLNTVF